mmetsp:Transcript_14594/g.30374  ORF Transcript_14594/g.30374 Transcript_14594/m.30374 type:complete len:268 (-) Transcript_14594:214-1017(-)
MGMWSIRYPLPRIPWKTGTRRGCARIDLKTLESFSPHSKQRPRSIRPGPWPKYFVPCLAFRRSVSDRSTISSAWRSMAALASATSSGVRTPRTIKYPFKSKRYFSSSVISMGYDAAATGVLSVALLVSIVGAPSVDRRRVVVELVGVNVTVVIVVAVVAALENARMVLILILVLETATLFLPNVGAKAKARAVVGVRRWRLARLTTQNIQASVEIMFREIMSASDGGIQVLFWRKQRRSVIGLLLLLLYFLIQTVRQSSCRLSDVGC